MLSPASARGTACATALDAAALPHPLREALTVAAATDEPVSGYWYDPPAAAARARALRAVLPDWATLLYAAKANSFRPVLEALGAPGGVDGFEVASAAEAVVTAEVLRTAGRPVRLAAAGPAKTPLLLRALLDAGVGVVHAESPLELDRLSALAQERGERVRVALRVNPSRVALSGSLAMGGHPSPFGIPEADVPAVLERARQLPGIDLVGFHVHAVCGNRDARTHVAYIGWCLDWAVRTAAAHGMELRWVDVGGGLGVAYDDQDPFDLELLGSGLDALAPPLGVEVVLEPGRWLTAGCGWYAAEVVDVKRCGTTNFAVVRGGIGGYALPGTEDFPFPVAVLPVEDWPVGLPRPEVRDASVTVVGEFCTPEDVLVRDVTVAHVRAGDLAVFPRAGAYGWEFALQSFLGHPTATRAVLVAPSPPSDPALRDTEPTR